jgi:ABC-type branched-subunit amino acid transport system substrate-binding protein
MRDEVMAEQSHRPQARRSILGAGAGALLALALSACTLVPAPPTGAPPATAEAEPAPPPQKPEEPAQAGEALAEERHKVAVLVPLTGPNAGVGQSLANAAKLALLDAGGDRITLSVYDTGGGAAGAAAKAIAEGNRLFLGPLLADDVRAVAPGARAAGVPVVSFSNDASVAGSGIYLMGFTPSQSVARVVGHARAAGAGRFAGLVPEGVYGRRAAQALVEAVQRGGGRLVGTRTYQRGAIGLRSGITALGSAGGWDAILVADGGRTAAAAAPLLRETPSGSARILGTELWANDADLGRTAALRGAWFAAPSDSMFDQLRTRYRARFGAAPYRLASLGYDAVLLAMRVGRDWRPGRPFPEGELRMAEGFAGLDGAFRFGPDGVAERALEVREVTAAGTIVISPAPRSFD